MIKTDVLIIGGGIIGCSIAYYLAREGVNVTLAEKTDIASGASGACDGFIFLQSKTPGIHLEMAERSSLLYEKIVSRMGCDIEYKRCGGMIAAETEEELEYLDELVERQRIAGLDVQILSQTQAREKIPYLADHIKGASFCLQDAQVNPILATLALADAALNKGAQILTGVFISMLDVDKRGKDKIVRSAFAGKEKIRADFVINATGAEAALVSKLIGSNLPVTPRRGQILVTESLPEVISYPLMNVSYLRTKFCNGERLLRDCGVSFEQTYSGNILIGSTREFVGYNKRTTYEGMTLIARNATTLLPKSRWFKVIRSFAGLRPYTPDNLPIIGFVPGVDNYLVATGHEGDGIALAPITGKLVTELIVRGKTSLDIGSLSPGRF